MFENESVGRNSTEELERRVEISNSNSGLRISRIGQRTGGLVRGGVRRSSGSPGFKRCVSYYIVLQ
jgi:hypothetical protein